MYFYFSKIRWLDEYLPQRLIEVELWAIFLRCTDPSFVPKIWQIQFPVSELLVFVSLADHNRAIV